MTESQITFETQDGRELLLEGVHYDVQIDGLMAKTAIVQNYSNPYDTNIEAVYTFPLSFDAVLLGIEIKINDRILKGTIIEKSEAEAKYEEAIDDGNRAIMVEKDSNGIYTVNIANLLPEDNISVSIEYTQLMEWRQDQVKWSLPTTIAPKYGNPSDLNLDDVTDPAISLLAENIFTFNMTVKGVLADSDITAPSHQIKINRNKEQTSIILENEKDFMDKDIVFTFKTQKSREERSFTLVGKDFDRYAAIASFYPSFGTDFPKQPKSVTFVIDCSGSMHGVSIDRARTALNKALHLFTEDDSFNIIKFGSHHSSLFDKEVPATQKNLNIAKRMIRSLDADMGGTEMAGALQSAYAGHTISKDKQGYLFLITDGQIYDHGNVISKAKKSEMSHYVVGVGYASDDSLLKSIAQETKGSYENIDPNEKMDDYILNLFKKIDTPKAIDIQVEWPDKPIIKHIPKVIFDGDTVYAYATFRKAPYGDILLKYTLENGNQYRTNVEISQQFVDKEENPSIVSKSVISKEIEMLHSKPTRLSRGVGALEKVEIIKLSTKYQLFSELTNYILVDEVAKNEKPISLPEMHRVESMMVERSIISASYSNESISHSKMNIRMCSTPALYSNDHEDIVDVPTFLRKQMDSPINDESDSLAFDALSEQSNANQQKDINKILVNVEASDYEKYLLLFNDWFIKYNRLPRKKNELSLAGFDLEIAGLFNKNIFREQIKDFVVRLYIECDEHDMLSDEFVRYIEKMLVKKGGIKDRVLEYVGGLF